MFFNANQWSEAWESFCIVAGAGGSAVFRELKKLPTPAPTAAGVGTALAAATRAARNAMDEGDTHMPGDPSLVARGGWFEIEWHSTGRSRVSISCDEGMDGGRFGARIAVEVCERDDGTPVPPQHDGDRWGWEEAPDTHWRWAALRRTPEV